MSAETRDRAAPAGRGSVAPSPGSAAANRAPIPHASDRAIAERVLKALFPGPLLRRQRVEVVVAAGQVTLSGTVATAEERSAAEQAARRVDGVQRVANLVAVQAQEWTEHAFLGPAAAYGRDGESGSVAGRIEALLERDADIDGTGIGIAAQGGRVVLTGAVRSWRERDLAGRVAWSAPGVTEVDDRMVVQGSAGP
ncbi:MAG TPA: BON domain-containing protein [Acetobacteraceae bacterium]